MNSADEYIKYFVSQAEEAGHDKTTRIKAYYNITPLTSPLQDVVDRVRSQLQAGVKSVNTTATKSRPHKTKTNRRVNTARSRKKSKIEKKAWHLIKRQRQK